VKWQRIGPEKNETQQPLRPGTVWWQRVWEMDASPGREECWVSVGLGAGLVFLSAEGTCTVVSLAAGYLRWSTSRQGWEPSR
jgi:hypothetical protein